MRDSHLPLTYIPLSGGIVKVSGDHKPSGRTKGLSNLWTNRIRDLKFTKALNSTSVVTPEGSDTSNVLAPQNPQEFCACIHPVCSGVLSLVSVCGVASRPQNRKPPFLPKTLSPYQRIRNFRTSRPGSTGFGNCPFFDSCCLSCPSPGCLPPRPGAHAHTLLGSTPPCD